MPQARINVFLNDERLASGTLALLSRLEVRESDSDPTVAALRLRLVQRPDGEFRPLDDELFVPGARVGVDLAVPGGLPQRLFQGILSHLRPHLEDIEANGYLELLCMDAALLLDAGERVAAWPDATDSEVAARIFSRYDIPVQAQDTPARHEAERRLLVQRGSDWAFLRRLARRNGFRLWLEYDPEQAGTMAWFGKPDLAGTPQADLILLQEGHCLTWIDAQFLATGPVRYRGAAIDPLDKRLLRGDGEPSLELLGEAGAAAQVEAGLSGAGAGGATALLADPEPLDPALAAQATAATDAARFVIELRGELDPALYRGLLRARRPVLVRGIGRRLSGTYYVQAVRTTLDEGALRQTFIAVRNATGLTGREDFGRSAEEVPPQ